MSGAALLELSLAKGGMADALKLQETSKTKLRSDLSKVKAAKTLLQTESEPTAEAIQPLRQAVQRLMCLAGSLHPEILCSMF